MTKFVIHVSIDRVAQSLQLLRYKISLIEKFWRVPPEL